MPKKVPQSSHIGSHIARRKGVYCYRRRLPGVASGEVCISLRTCRFREAEHRAAILDAAFDDALRRARENVTDAVDLNTILREYLKKFLREDLERRMERPPGTPVYGHGGSPATPGLLQTRTFKPSDKHGIA